MNVYHMQLISSFFFSSSIPPHHLFCLCFIEIGFDVVQVALQILYSQGLPHIPDPTALASWVPEIQETTTTSAF